MKRIKKTIYLVVVIVLGVLVTCNFINNERSVMEKLLNFCENGNVTQVDLKEIITFEWDEIFVVYGPMISEIIYRDYKIAGPDHVTDDNDVSWYFISKGKVMLIEKNSDYKKKRASGNIIEFEDRTNKSNSLYHGSSVSVVIPYSQSLLNIKKRVNVYNPAFFIYALSPVDQNK